MDSQGAGIDHQSSKRWYAIGSGTPSGVVESLANFAWDAAIDDFYHRHSEVAFWYQTLEKPGWESKVKDVADLWVKAGENWQC